ncbi:sel1 repeat family protein, partial [Psychrobacter sp. 16-Bac2893]
MSASPLTPLDYIATGYWQDFLARRAVAGGIAYEVDLHHCGLDESLASLQRIDTLLSQIRRDMVKTSIWDEATLLKDERYRNFLVFLAFYAGRVLAQQWQQSPRWFGQFELDARYPELVLTTDDFYQHMAMFYGADTDVNTKDSSDKGNMPLFFALEPIGMRLFGHIDRAFKSAQGDKVASGLYQAVSARLPKAVNHQPHLVDRTVADKPNTQTTNEKAFIEKVSPENSSTSLYSNSKSSIDMATTQLSDDKMGNVSSISATTITSVPLAEYIEITNATVAPIVEPVKTTAVAKKL